MTTRIFVVIALTLMGCAPIEHKTTVSQNLGQQMVAGPGDMLVHVDHQRNLVNAFGGSDIFGRKTAEGFSEVYFSGVENDGTIVLYRTGVTIVSNETTMSRTPMTQSFGAMSGSASTNGNNTNFNASGTETTIQTAPDYHVAVPQGAIAIRLPMGTKEMPFEGYVIDIVSATPVALTYRVSQAKPQ
jgi:hypothetical protein